MSVRIREASQDDEPFVLSLVPRLVEFGPPRWRDPAGMIATDAEVLRTKLRTRPPGTAIFIAEDEGGRPLGFIHLQPGTDYYYTFTGDPHGHVADVIVIPEAEGRGIGRLLLDKAEEWAYAQGYRWLTLSVFAQNARAREVYRKLGYGEDMMRYVKGLERNNT